ncbi:AEC family transporter, partial [Lactobacillus parabuchneri]|nr:AEC family transporter [Lentilactobacillus parabuchneri]
LGVYLIQKDGKGEGHFSWKQTLKKVFSPPLLGFMVGVVLVLMHVTLPDFLMEDFNYIGNLTIPLSMIFIGISINSVDLSNLHFDRSNFLILFGRFLLAPLVMSLLVIPTPLPTLMKQVFIMQS